MIEDGGEDEDCGNDTGTSEQTQNSIGYLTGHKYERASDLSVSVSGRDFQLIREYSSDPDFYPLIGSGYLWRGNVGDVVPGYLGAQWNANIFRYLGGDFGGGEFGADLDELYLGGFPLRSVRKYIRHGVGSDTLFAARSSSNQRVEPRAAVLPGFGANNVTSSVWRLREPGKMETDFVRNYDITPAGVGAFGLEDLIGLPIFERDEFGNTWWYEYAMLNTGSTNSFRDPVVLTSIYLNWDGGTDSTTKSDDSWAARIDFLWNGLTDHPNITNGGGSADDITLNPYQSVTQFDGSSNPNHHYGRIAEIRVVRDTGSGELVTQKARYLYYDDITDIANPLANSHANAPDTLGEIYDASEGDLCEVIVSTMVERDEGQFSDPFHERVWQYRYYSERFVEPTLGTANPIDFDGADHQLLAVFYPEQIEFFSDHFAQQSILATNRTTPFSSATQGAETLRWITFTDDPSDTLGAMGDNWTDYFEPNEHWHNLFDVASKVLTYYDATSAENEGLVRSQIVNSGDASGGGCGCGGGVGGARLGKRYDYLYQRYDWDAIPDGVPSETVNGAVVHDGYTCHMVESRVTIDMVGMMAVLEYEPYRVFSHDYVQPYGERYHERTTSNSPLPVLGPLGMSWKVASTVSEAEPSWDYSETDNPISTTGRMWVNLYQFSPNGPTPSGSSGFTNYHKVTKHATPSAVDWASYMPSQYDAVNGWFDPPVLPSIQSGLVQEQGYSGGWTSSSLVRDGASVSEYAEPVTITYSANRPDLVTKIERHPVPSPTGAQPAETIEFVYGYHTDGGSDPYASIVAWKRIDVTAENADQNGPANATPALVYSSYVMYDEQGQVRWRQDADGVLTYYEYDETTGALTTIVRDADPAGGYVDTSTASLSSSFPNLSSVGGWSAPTATSFEELTDSYTNDELGRMISHTDASGATRYTRYEVRFTDNVQSDGVLAYRGVPLMAHMSFPYKLSDGSFDGPIVLSLSDAGGRNVRTSMYSVSESASYSPATGSYTFVAEEARNDTERMISGLPMRSREWHNVSATTPVSSLSYRNEGSYVTSYEYDTLGRLRAVIDAEDGVTAHTSFDIMDRPLVTERGVRDWGNPDSTEVISQVYYDSGQSTTQGVGNGNVTLSQSLDGEGNTRSTTMWYDYRDRMVAQENPLAPHHVYAYDDLNRVTERASYTFASMPSTPPEPFDSSYHASRSTYTRTHHNNRGMVYKTQTAIDPTASSPTYLESNSWFDADGNVIASWSPNSPATKYEYDALDRPVVVYQTDRDGDAAPGAGSLADAQTLTDDHVISQTEYAYIGNGEDGAGQVELVTSRMRHHDAKESGTGEVTGALTTSNSVATYTGYVYDDASRQTHTLSYGTGDSSGFVSSTSAPTPFDTNRATSDALISSVGFDEWGRVQSVFDPENKETRSLYDDLSRTIATIEHRALLYSSPTANEITWDDVDNWEVAWPGGSASVTDQDRVTTFTYDGLSNVLKRTAHLNDGSVQVTQYVYGTTEGSSSNTMDSLVDSSNLLSKVHYPNESTGAADTSAAYTVSYAYNRLGELRGTTDQNGTVHKLTRDDLGRIQEDYAESFASGSPIDQTVRKITASFDIHGRIDEVESLNGSSTVLNGVKFEYTPLHQIKTVHQDQGGAVVVNTSPRVEYSYSDAVPGSGGGNYSRIAGMRYPSDVGGSYDTISMDYSGQTNFDVINDRISRVFQYTAPSWNSTTPPELVSYEYLGGGMAAKVNYPDIMTSLTAIQGYSGSSAAGAYPGFDQYGRRIWHAWVRHDATNDLNPINFGMGSSGQPDRTPLMARRYAYDMMSNRTHDWDGRPGAVPDDRDWEYQYDGLDRLKTAIRGLRDDEKSPTAIGTIADFSRQWNLDMLGNWGNVITDIDGDTLFEAGDETEVRAFNSANEITSREAEPGSGPSGSTPLPFEPTYDKAGNFRTNGASSGSNNLRYTHDAWNRLVKVERTASGGDITILENTFNGLNWRVSRAVDLSKGAYNGLDEKRVYYYSAGWQMIEERVDRDVDTNSDSSGGADDDTDYVSQQVWGTRYIDDAVAKRITEDSVSRVYFYLTDAMFSVRALVNSSGFVQERIDYTPYGKAIHRYAADYNEDGALTGDDYLIHQTNMGGGGLAPGSAGYDPDVDSNGDGSMDSSDTTNFGAIYSAQSSNTVPAGWLTDPRDSSWTDNSIGYDGYHFDYAGATDGTASGLYHVRHRVYDPGMGGWLERDPMLYVESMSLYQYAAGSPILRYDPYGQRSQVVSIKPPGKYDTNCDDDPLGKQALQDPRVAAAIRATAMACSNNPAIDPQIHQMFTLFCDPGCDDGGYTPTNMLPPHTTVCTGPTRTLNDVVSAMLHELTHARQKCRNSENFYLGCENAICAELDGYSSEPGYDESINNIQTDYGKLSTRCSDACRSASVNCSANIIRSIGVFVKCVKYDSNKDDPYTRCKNRCMNIAKDCKLGFHRPQ